MVRIVRAAEEYFPKLGTVISDDNNGHIIGDYLLHPKTHRVVFVFQQEAPRYFEPEELADILTYQSRLDSEQEEKEDAFIGKRVFAFARENQMIGRFRLDLESSRYVFDNYEDLYEFQLILPEEWKWINAELARLNEGMRSIEVLPEGPESFSVSIGGKSIGKIVHKNYFAFTRSVNDIDVQTDLKKEEHEIILRHCRMLEAKQKELAEAVFMERLNQEINEISRYSFIQSDDSYEDNTVFRVYYDGKRQGRIIFESGEYKYIPEDVELVHPVIQKKLEALQSQLSSRAKKVKKAPVSTTGV